MNGEGPIETVSRFTGLANDYDRFRPTYPPEAIAAILDRLPIRPTVVDVGAGTGISTRALAAGGAHAIAIEPNDEMRAIAIASGIDARPGTATATGLTDRCAEAVTAFQAFHWFAHPEALDEFHRILRAAGRIAFVWNERDTSDRFTAEYARLEREHCASAGVAAIDFPDERASELLSAHRFENIRRLAFPNPQRLDVEGVLGRMRSTSYAPKAPGALAVLLDALRATHADHADSGGFVTFAYRTDVTLAEARPA